MPSKRPHTFFALAAAAMLLVASLGATTPAAQRREHLTPEEIELVRDNQELDKRTDVFVGAAERRLLAISDPAGASKQFGKEKWGEVKGTRAQLVYDISKILEEAVTNIDDTAGRDASSKLLRKSLFRLSESASRFLPQLTTLRESAQDEAERDTIERAIETAQDIVEAAGSHKVTADDLKVKEDRKGKKAN